ncbi:ATP-grasp domain-containing protein [Romboutsia sp.]|uniref:ATP-grasp domain-containing protein n=1 Tax=Romboutsia sp. TaxID=1965302 RepID=UPI003F3A3161
MKQKEINILILSSYNNIELVNEFIKAKEELNINGKIVTSDMNKNVPTAFIGDKHVYIRHLAKEGADIDIIKVCNEENISLIIPIMDKQLRILCKYKENIEKNTNAKIMISDENVIDIVRDKFKTSEFLKAKGFYTPKIITDEDIDNENYEFPLYIKPFDGGGSIDNFILKNKKELDFFKDYLGKTIIQEFINGEEYCVDIFNDFEGNPITIVPKKRIKAMGGTILEGKIEKNRIIIETMKDLVHNLKPCGEINVDCILVDDKVYIIEVNGRISAGAIFSYKAGASTPKNLYRLLCGEKLKYNEDYINNLTFIKYIKFFLNNGDNVISGL